MLVKDIQKIEQRVQSFTLDNKEKLEEFKRLFTGKKGMIAELFSRFKAIDAAEKREAGKSINQIKQLAEKKYAEAAAKLQKKQEATAFDYTLPGLKAKKGSLHPITKVMDEISQIFKKIGFVINYGPEIEDDWHNFTALNFPANHPARDMQDTFFVDDNNRSVLRTHTSPVQVRTLLERPLPVRIISPGRVFRCDSDATHSPVFNQVEGIYVDKGISFADMQDVLFYFVRSLFGTRHKVRFRPSYFPFTEPSAEIDISWQVKNKTQWMEIMGCGMVDPNVLKNCNIDAEKYSGYAFGIGVERVAMLQYGISDIRSFYENDCRFLRQF